MHDIYGHATGGPPFPNNSFMRPPPGIMGPSDANVIHLSSADVYRQTHEVTATVCILFISIRTKGAHLFGFDHCSLILGPPCGS